MASKSSKKVPLILVSNDDGFYSEGIKILAKRLKAIGKVIIVAPDQERSAASHSLTLHRPLRVKKVEEDVYAVDGTPTDCITLGVKEILPRTPDLIVSGINKGANLGDDVHYSGTVSAAVEGGIMGIPGIAISLMGRENLQFEPSARFAVKLAKKVLKEGLPSGIILNVNVPNVSARQIKGYQFTKQGKRNYGDIIAERIDPRGRKYYWIGGDEHGFEDIPDSDCNAILANIISITPIRVNLTDHQHLENLREWKL
ncbi:MAG: 5'/3'-nucleotidase SurE [Deltaproteobacteria bacterium]|nr:5'/3'-nucleotidase SurE [Deltaproteobacteria bacterium]